MHIKFEVENPEGDLDIDRRIILKWVIKKQCKKM
jgi:hypothetical protein